MLAEGVKR